MSKKLDAKKYTTENQKSGSCLVSYNLNLVKRIQKLREHPVVCHTGFLSFSVHSGVEFGSFRVLLDDLRW